MAAGGCGGGSTGSVDAKFRRADGSLVMFPKSVSAWCGPYDADNRDTEAVHILAGELPRDESPSSFWIVSAVRADIDREPTTTLPNDFVYTEPEGAGMFALDAEDRENELSSAEEESSGTIRVEVDGWDPGDTVRVDFDDVLLGSELHDLPSVSVEGSVRAEIGDAPEGL